MRPAPQFLVIEDQPMMRDMVAHMLHRIYPRASVAVAGGIEDGIEQARQLTMNDVVVLDLGLPGIAGLASLRRLRSAVRWARILVFSASEEAQVIGEAKRMGAFGYVPKSFSAQRFAAAVDRVLAGELAFPDGLERMGGRAKLSAAELELLHVLDAGARAGTRAELARTLCVTERTVKRRLAAIYGKLGVKSRVEAIARARQMGALRGE